NIIHQVKASIKNKTAIPNNHNTTINSINSTHNLDIPTIPT
ncbi:17997_t:CDS:1, partial [Racocetra persica]